MKGLLLRCSKWPHPRLCKAGCTMCWELQHRAGREAAHSAFFPSASRTFPEVLVLLFVKSHLFVKLTVQNCSGAGFHFSGITRSLEMTNAPFASSRHGTVLALQNPFYHILGHKTKVTPVDASCPDSLASGRFNL